MNSEDVKALIKEWVHKPPGSRPLLDKAIAEQYRKSREGQWLGLCSDELLEWLRDALVGEVTTKNGEQELESRITALLTAESDAIEPYAQESLMAALKATPEHGATSGTLPTDEDIAIKVKSLLHRLDTEGHAPRQAKGS